uniref:Uncharacterized protein n=1 Tax=Nelumbo nucifera TaxID=4432 RepID=A0A822YRL4_NELNU|nr:TPA_asm: hypothetical protein HUJ06_010689 [Nelumbo nucifera]
MQASAYAFKGSLGSEFQQRRVLSTFGGFGERRSSRRILRFPDRGFYCGSPLASVSVGAELSRARTKVQTISRSSAKARSVKAQASGSLIISLV